MRIHVVLLSVLFAAPAWAAELLDLAVGDVLAKPGETVEVVAKLEKKTPRGTNVPGASVELRLDGKTVGTATTDERGMARFKVTAPDRGDHRLKGVFEGTGDLLRAEYNALLAVRKPDEPILAVDVDWTISMTDDLNTSAGGVDCPPVKDAPEAMERLEKKYTIVYVTSRARQLRKRTISWLFRYGFPRGATFYLDPREYPTYDVVAFKTALLKDLVARFPGLKVGIGNDPDDRAAYEAAGLKPVMIGKAKPPAQDITWPEIEKALEAR
jgi:hypothetical protein